MYTLGILGFISEKCNLKYPKIKAGFMVICVIVLIINILDHFNSPNYHVIQLYISAALLLIIYLWIYYAPKCVIRIQKIRTAFDEKDYLFAYMQYRLNIMPVRACSKILDENEVIQYSLLNDLEIKDDGEFKEYLKKNYKKHQEYKNYKYKNHKHIKTAYFLLWTCISAFIVISIWEIRPFTFTKIANTVLLIFSIFLNYYSFYAAIAYAYFIRTLFRKNIDEWKYNKYIPSATHGFSLLVSNVKMNSLIFFLISSLYTFVYMLILYSPSTNIELVPKEVIFVQVNIIVLAGSGMTVALFIAGHFFLQRILLKWKETTLQELDENSCNVYNGGIANKLDYTALIQKVISDKIQYSYTNIPSMALTLIIVILNILNIYKMILELFI
ncbi:MAG: hypothetical protein ACLU5E_06825 [Anaerovoracaceae bacterium]